MTRTLDIAFLIRIGVECLLDLVCGESEQSRSALVAEQGRLHETSMNPGGGSSVKSMGNVSWDALGKQDTSDVILVSSKIYPGDAGFCRIPQSVWRHYCGDGSGSP